MVDMHIAVILDRSGSMQGRTDAVIEHLNSYKEEVANLPENVEMSIYQFDTEYEPIVESINARVIPDLTSAVYYPRGGTALLDAIGRTIANLDRRRDLPAKVVVVINTDGAENSSREYTQNQIKQLVTDRQSQKDWQFVFVGAGIDAFGAGAGFGVRYASTYQTTNSAQGYQDSYHTLTRATTSYAGGQSTIMDMTITVPDEEEEKDKDKTTSESS